MPNKRCLYVVASIFFSGIFSSARSQTTNDTINPLQLKTYLEILASDSMKGRENYSLELYQCADFIAKEFQRVGLKESVVLKSYFQPFTVRAKKHPTGFPNIAFRDASGVLLNVIGILPGRSLAHEVIIFSAHYDHLGADSSRRKDKVFNGANDNASGTAALLSLANYYSLRNDNERTIAFCAFAGCTSNCAGL